MPDDTLKQRAEKFREEWPSERERLPYPINFRKDLIAEIRWARENPDEKDMARPDHKCWGCYLDGWDKFADHILDCLGGKMKIITITKERAERIDRNVTKILLEQKLQAQAALIRDLGQALKITWEEYAQVFETKEDEIPNGIKQRFAAYNEWLKENPEEK